MRLFTQYFLMLLLVITQVSLWGQQVEPAATVVIDGVQQRHVITALTTEQVLTINNLIPGETYHFTIPEDPSLPGCIPSVAVKNAKIDVKSYDPALRLLVFQAQATSQQLTLEYPCTWDSSNPPRHYVSVACQTCVKTSINEYLRAQQATIVVESGISADELVRDVLIGGNCFDITGVQFVGNPAQIGRFSQGQTNIGFATGLVMATGDINVCVGPNDSDNASQGFGNSIFDGDLAQLSGSSATFDLANIEFDFTPTQSPLTFEFVFASEEYCEYVGSAFNDAFGFFIDGPGITGPFGGAANIAVIPATTTYVAINNVNHLNNAAFYVNNTPAGGTLCGQSASFLQSTNELQFDGYTRRFTATANVIPCQTYHIKLKICDIGDGIFDSAVFLRDGSFDAGGSASVEWIVNGEPDVNEAFEGCDLVQLLFDRVGGNLNVPLPVQFTIMGTATSGADYSPIPFTVVIPAGQDQFFFPVNIIADLIAEGVENITITLNNPCSCLNPQETLLINDLPILTAIADTTIICGPGTATVFVSPEGGIEPYTFNWSNFTTGQSITPFVFITSTYRVTVTDDCGQTFVATAQVQVNPPPNAQMVGPAPQLCPGQEAGLTINFNGTGPFTIEYNFNGDAQPPITDITSDPYTLIINEPGLYQLTAVIDAGGCQGAGTGALLVLESTLNLNGIVTNPTCNGVSNGSINTTVLGGQGPYNYSWSGPSPIANIPDPINILAGTYLVTVTDGFGCTRDRTFTVVDPAPMVPTIVNVQGVNCYSPNGGNINLQVTGGVPNYGYLWNNGATIQDPQNLQAGFYSVVITDQAGCTRTATATVPSDIVPPIATATTPGNLNCITSILVLNGNGSSTGVPFTYNWTASPGNITSGGTTLQPTVNQAGSYTLLVTNQINGCTAAAQVVIASDLALPTANAGPNQTLTCAVQNIALNGSGSSQGGNFTFTWSSPNGGVINSGNGTTSPVVNIPATYVLLVTNTTNGCTSTDDAVVAINTTPPNAAIATPNQITCTQANVTLNGGGSTPVGTLGFSWFSANGFILSGPSSQNPVVNAIGQYTLTVTNTVNGCTDTETVTVSQDFTEPLASVAPSGPLTCAVTQITLQGGATPITPNNLYSWASSSGGGIISGANTLNPVINQPGIYTLTATNTVSNCSSSASVLITQNNLLPAANAGSIQTLNCLLTSISIGDSSATTAPNLTYAWTASGGGNITAGSNTPTPTVNQPGTYTLVVTNSTNNCSNTASIAIPQNNTLPNAVVAQAGQLTCSSPSIQLNANGSSTGANFSYDWTSSTGGGIGAGGTTLTPTVTAAGTYTLLVTNSTNGCTSTASTTVTSNANLPTAVAQPSGIITCSQNIVTLNANGSTTGPTITYNWATGNGQVVSGQGTQLLNVSSAGTYTLIVTNTTNNCSATFALDVTNDLALPVADAGGSPTLDCTIPTVSLNGNASSQGPNFTYLWVPLDGGTVLPPNNILTPSVSAPGTYQLVVTNSINGCTSADNVNVLQDDNDPVVVIATPVQLNCIVTTQNIDGNGSSTGNNMVYNWSGPAIVSGVGTQSIVIDGPGTYTLLITNTDNGCTTDESVVVAEDVLAPPVDAGPDLLLDCYEPTQQVGGPGNPVGNNYTFVWTGVGIVSGGDLSNAVIDQGGNYVLLVTNTNNGCTSTDQVNVTTNFVTPQANAGPTFELTCVNNQYAMQSTGSTGANFAYGWTTNTGSFLSPTTILNPIVNGAGFYFLTVTNTTNGCTSTSSVQITQSADVPIAVAGLAQLLTCADTLATLNGINSSTGTNFIYEWYPDPIGNIVGGINALIAVVNEPGNYTLAVTDTTNNCTSYSSVIVSQNVNLPVVDAGLPPTLTCNLPTTTLIGSVGSSGNFLYNWQVQSGGNIVSGANTLTAVVNAVGIYEFIVTNTNNGCSNNDVVAVLADQNNPVAAIQQPGLLTCTNNTLALNATGSSIGNVSYIWTTANGNIVDQTDPLLVVVDETGIYQLQVTNPSNGCTATATVQVNNDVLAPNAEAGTAGLITCANTTQTLNGAGSSLGNNFVYIWNTIDGSLLTGITTLTPVVTTGGTYSLLVTNTSNGCTNSDQITVNVNTQAPLAVVVTPDILTCTEPEVTLSGTGSQTGAGISYAWATTGGGNLVGNTNALQVVANQSGTYILTVLNSANGCTATATTAVTENIMLPVAEAGSPFTLTCSVDEITLQGSGSMGANFIYTWSTNGGQILSGANSPNPVVNADGLYLLLVTNQATGCTQTDQTQVFLEPNVPTNFLFTLTPPGCKDNDGVIVFDEVVGGVEPYTYSINGGNTYLPASQFSSIQPGTYDLWIQDANGCEFNLPLLVPMAPDPGITVDPQIQLEFGSTTEILAQLPPGYPLSLIDTIVWTPLEGLIFANYTIPGLLNPTIASVRPTQYTVTLYSVDGCNAQDRILVRVDNEPNIYIPNVFSPDQNGENDIVYIFAKDSQVRQIKSFAIFDRWGERVFEDFNFQPNDPAHGWDGNFRGDLLNPAVFVYVAEIELIDGRLLLYKGDVTLVR